MPSKQPTPPPETKKIYVRVCGDHPLAGRPGWLLATAGGAWIFESVVGIELFRVEFWDGSECHLERHQIETLALPPEFNSPPPPLKR